MAIKVIAKAGSDYIIAGTDALGQSGQQTLDATEYLDFHFTQDLHAAGDEFDSALDEFYKPMLDAVAKLTEAQNRKPAWEDDPLRGIRVGKDVEGEAEEHSTWVNFGHDMQILLAIEKDVQSRLLWTDDSIVLTDEPVVADSVPDPNSYVQQDSSWAEKSAE